MKIFYNYFFLNAYRCDTFVTTSHKKNKIKIFKNEFKKTFFLLSMMCSEHEK